MKTKPTPADDDPELKAQARKAQAKVERAQRSYQTALMHRSLLTVDLMGRGVRREVLTQWYGLASQSAVDADRRRYAPH